MRLVLGLIATLGVLRGVGSLWFGGERFAPGDDVEEPDAGTTGAVDRANWHHQDLTGRACRTVGFGDAARRSVQWHADYIDSYMYNPIFWVQGGLARIRRAFMLQEHLVKLHFDDLLDTTAIEHVWQRYLAGTAAGLQHAAGRDDVPAARNLVGLSLHAIQDFYSHSNWVDDPARRTETYLERKQRLGWGPIGDRLHTGTYERPDTQGVRPHGRFEFRTPVLQQEPLKTVLKGLCHPRSPASGTGVCAAYRAGADSAALRPGVLSFNLPGGVVAVSEGGVALDNRWIADNSARNRDTADKATGSVLFAAAKELALRDSVLWLTELGRLMAADASTAAFWTRVRTQTPVEAADRAAVYEDVGRLPVLFTAVGDYPVMMATLPSDDSWYLYLQVGTGSNGTDAEVVVDVDGRRFPLDHGSRADLVTGYDDFTSGSTVAYAVGPFPALPGSITLRHEVKQVDDLVKALGRAATRVGQALVDTLSGLLPGGADDHVGRAHLTWDAAMLGSVKKATTQPWSLTVGRPGSEGHYELRGRITYRGDVPGPGSPGALAERVSEFEIELQSVRCHQESGTDGVFTTADEVYFLTTVTNHSGLPMPPGGTSHVEGWLSPVWSNVDSGDETTTIRKTWTLRVPTTAGAATLGVEAWEEDNDSRDVHRRRQDEFTKAVGGRDTATISGVIDVLGSAIEDGWDLRSVEAFAFQRRRTDAGWSDLRTDLTPRHLGRNDTVRIALTSRRSGRFSLFPAPPGPVRLAPPPSSGTPFDDGSHTHGRITGLVLYSGDIVDGVQVTHHDGTVVPVRGQASSTPTRITFPPEDPFVGVSGDRGRYYGADAVIRLTVHFRSGRTVTVGNDVHSGAVTRFDRRASEPARWQVVGLVGSTVRHSSGQTYLESLGVVVGSG